MFHKQENNGTRHRVSLRMGDPYYRLLLHCVAEVIDAESILIPMQIILSVQLCSTTLFHTLDHAKFLFQSVVS
jgi:hypothetical protein